MCERYYCIAHRSCIERGYQTKCYFVYLYLLQGSSVLPDPVDGELDLRNVTTTTSGSYLCVAANNVGVPAQRSVELSVRGIVSSLIVLNRLTPLLGDKR
jgi:hypothetical protein